jgi:hypothetical protein
MCGEEERREEKRGEWEERRWWSGEGVRRYGRDGLCTPTSCRRGTPNLLFRRENGSRTDARQNEKETSIFLDTKNSEVSVANQQLWTADGETEMALHPQCI